MRVFTNDDAGYLAWVNANPNGFTVNADRRPRADNLVLHQADCFWMSDPSKPTGAWTHRAYIKACSEDLAELERWAREETGGTLRHCQKCHPI